MRTHTYSIALAHLESGHWTVAVLQTRLKAGVMVDQRLVWGPVWVAEPQLDGHLAHALKELRQLVRSDEAARLSR